MTATGNAIAKANSSPAALVGQYKDDFALVLPASFRPETFVRLVQGCLRRDQNLAQAAQDNPGSLMHSLLDAARLGHEPGTDEYYLVPRKRKGQREVLGIEGYKGITKRMMQHPNVLSVVAETVHKSDTFEWVPGQMERPRHVADWFGDRGDLIGAYAYAILAGGATSRVVVIGPREIAQAQSASDGATSQYSPWKRFPDSMYRKTALRRLEPFVPKATELLAEQHNRTVAAAEVTQQRDLPELPPVGVDADTGEITDPLDADDVVEAEVVNGDHGDYEPNPGFGDDQ